MAILAILSLCLIVPVNADSGTISIAYRGSGGSYIGDSVIFDGRNTLGNTTVIRLTGPGLPAEGVPPYDITGTPGAGNTALVNDNGIWFFVWDTGRVVGGEKLQTARYTLTAFDKDHPEKTVTTSIMLKKPDFSITATPNPSQKGEYVQLTGNAEKGISYVVIEILDPSGTVLHTFMAPVSASGYFQYGFHVDMQPDTYTLKISNPAMKKGMSQSLTVVKPEPVVVVTATTAPAETTVPTTNLTVPATESPTLAMTTPASPDGTGAILISSNPVNAEVYVDSVLAGKTPLTLDTIAPGVHTIQIRAEGYLPYSVDVVIKKGEPLTISPTLISGPSRMPLSPVTVIIALISAVLLASFAGKRMFP